MADIVLSKPQESTFPSGQTATMTKWNRGGWRGDAGRWREWGNQRGGGERERGFHLSYPRKPKISSATVMREAGFVQERVRFKRVKLCSLVNPFYFVSPSAVFKGNGVYTCGWATVACKDVREWGWIYGCVGSGWLLCAFGGVTCAAHCGVDAQKRFAFIE